MFTLFCPNTTKLEVVFHCSLALVRFGFFVSCFSVCFFNILIQPTKQIVYELTSWVHSPNTCTTVVIFILCIFGKNCWPIFTSMSLSSYCIWCTTHTLSFTRKFIFIHCWTSHLLREKYKNKRISFHIRLTNPELYWSLKKFTIPLKKTPSFEAQVNFLCF